MNETTLSEAQLCNLFNLTYDQIPNFFKGYSISNATLMFIENLIANDSNYNNELKENFLNCQKLYPPVKNNNSNYDIYQSKFIELFKNKISFPKHYFLLKLYDDAFNNLNKYYLNNFLESLKDMLGEEKFLKTVGLYLKSKSTHEGSFFRDPYFKYCYKLKKLSPEIQEILIDIVNKIYMPRTYIAQQCKDVLRMHCFIYQFTQDKKQIMTMVKHFAKRADFLQQNEKMLTKVGIDINDFNDTDIPWISSSKYEYSFQLNRNPIIQKIKVSPLVAEKIALAFLTYVQSEISDNVFKEEIVFCNINSNKLSLAARSADSIQKIEDYILDDLKKFKDLVPYMINIENNDEIYFNFIKTNIKNVELLNKLNSNIKIIHSVKNKNKI